MKGCSDSLSEFKTTNLKYCILNPYWTLLQAFLETSDIIAMSCGPLHSKSQIRGYDSPTGNRLIQGCEIMDGCIFMKISLF